MSNPNSIFLLRCVDRKAVTKNFEDGHYDKLTLEKLLEKANSRRNSFIHEEDSASETESESVSDSAEEDLEITRTCVYCGKDCTNNPTPIPLIVREAEKAHIIYSHSDACSYEHALLTIREHNSRPRNFRKYMMTDAEPLLKMFFYIQYPNLCLNKLVKQVEEKQKVSGKNSVSRKELHPFIASKAYDLQQFNSQTR